MNKTELLNKFSKDPEERVVLARVLDQMERTQNRSIPCATQFLSPAQRAAAEPLLVASGLVAASFTSLTPVQTQGFGRFTAASLPMRTASLGPHGGPTYLFFGGYENAERTVCAFLPDWMEGDDWLADEENPVGAMEASFPEGAGLTHRDLLGGLMGIGLTREKVGDILVLDGRAQIVALKEAIPIILSQFGQAGRYRLQLKEIPLSALTPAPVQVKLVKDTVATLRLDAVLSSGFSIARGKAADLINSGRVSVNHRECTKTDKAVAEGDILTCRGLGKCILKSVGGQSRKGRIMIEMERYV